MSSRPAAAGSHTLAALAGVCDEAVAVQDARSSLSWAELERTTAQFANGLQSLGVRPGQHVAIQASNRVEFLIAVIGAWRAGCPYTPIKSGWTPVEVDVVAEEAATVAIVTDRAASREIAARRNLVLIDLDEDFDAWLQAQADTATPDEQCGWKLPFTSGTTGRAKGVVPATAGRQSFSESWAGLAAYAQMLELPGEGVHLFATRLFNGAPLTFGLGALARGATLRILSSWEPAAGLAELCRPDVTSTILVPTMFRQLLRLRNKNQQASPGLKTILHGGEPCPISVKQAMIEWFGPVLVEFYGFTEGGMSIVDSMQWLRRPGTVGRPMAGLEVSIRDANGAEVPVREEGTICFAQRDGKRRFTYLGDAAKTEAAHMGSAQGAHFTVGDVGWMDDDGFLYISGRIADVVIVGGVNVYPAEIDQALADVPGVADLCAVGASDEIRGERIVLVAALTQGSDEQAVRTALATAAERSLAPYKRPTEVIFTEVIPRDETGKLLRAVVRDSVKGMPHATHR